MVMHEECSEGNFDSIRRLRETNTPNVSYVRQVTALPLYMKFFVLGLNVSVLCV